MAWYLNTGATLRLPFTVEFDLTGFASV